MDVITALHNRVSCALLKEPGPSSEQLETMLRAAARAPDHAMLKPWRFLLIEGDARHDMGELLLRAALEAKPDSDAAALEKVKRKAMRAPTILVVIASPTEHPKVPEIEQIITAGAAANNLVMAAFALGLGAYWRTGGAAYNSRVKKGLGLSEREQIVGFIYLGTPQVRFKPAPEIEVSDYLKRWIAFDE